MGWFLTLLTALLSGAVGLVLGGLVMALCIRWYEISSFEGKSGYALVGMALLGGIAGFAIGLTVALVLPDTATLPFLAALGLSAAIVLALAGLGAGLARAFADVPPTLGGRELELEVEIRMPSDPAELSMDSPDDAYVELGATRRGVCRTSERGRLYLDAVRHEAGSWIVPASADVFTGRGERLFLIQLGEEPLRGFLVPLPARPGRRFLSWSEWAPFPWPGQPPAPDAEASFRFRIRQEEPEPSTEEAS